MKEYIVKFSDNNNYDRRRQKVWSDNEDEKVKCRFRDLNDCPEDAIIGRDLFDANDFIATLKLGFAIAKRGYDCITVEEELWD